ncbi:hypothetical protein LguiB_030364 [Lonicera macranthoides]
MYGRGNRHRHNCFNLEASRDGCDASILIDPTPGKPSKKEHPANGATPRGLEVIDEAKAKLEATCPKTVSYADIVAFVAFDVAFVAFDGPKSVGGVSYLVPAGRRDGTTSLLSEIGANLPPPVADLSNDHANLDFSTPNRLDNQYYVGLKKSMGLLPSDQALAISPLTSGIVNKYTNNATLRAADFAAAMVYLSTIDVITGTAGQIRIKCSIIN